MRRERPRRLFPAHDVRPLIDEDRQIAVRFDPLRVHRADQDFRRRPDCQRLGQLFGAAARYPRNLRGETFDVLGFLSEQTLGNEERKVGVFVSGRLKARVEIFLQIFPQTESVRAQHDAAAHRRVRDELRAQTDGGVPCGEVGRFRRDLPHDGRPWGLRHDRPRFACVRRAAFPKTGHSGDGRAFGEASRMPKHTRIYTRTGDAGTTGLVGGARIKKDAPRIDAYGTVDELSSAIGVARAELRAFAERPRAARLDAWLAWTQDMLFNLGSRLATPAEDLGESAAGAGDAGVAALERGIDEAEADLAPLNAFILPSGSLPGAQLHVARTTCRRAERRLVALAETERVPVEAARFLNRLSTRSSSGRVGSTTTSTNRSTAGTPTRRRHLPRHLERSELPGRPSTTLRSAQGDTIRLRVLRTLRSG